MLLLLGESRVRRGWASHCFLPSSSLLNSFSTSGHFASRILLRATITRSLSILKLDLFRRNASRNSRFARFLSTARLKVRLLATTPSLRPVFVVPSAPHITIYFPTTLVLFAKTFWKSLFSIRRDERKKCALSRSFNGSVEGAFISILPRVF